MRKTIDQHECILSYRLRKTAEARIVRSSQMPADFFGHHRSFHVSADKQKVSLRKKNPTLDEFVKMFKMNRVLKNMAKKVNNENLWEGKKSKTGSKQNIQLPVLKNIKKNILRRSQTNCDQ